MVGKINAATGDIDPLFVPPTNVGGRQEMVTLPDGKFLLLGNRLERFDENGNPDPTFQCKVSFSSAAVAALPNGKILSAGISVIDGSFRRGVLRFLPDGTVDNSFPLIPFESVTALALESEGRFLIGGTKVIGGSLKTVLLRFNADGTTDSSFSSTINGSCHGIFIQPDDSILIGGSFSTVGGLPRTNTARLLPNGDVDPNFTANCGGGTVSWILGMPDGKILIGGTFTSVNSSTTGKIARVDPLGMIDPSFTAASVISSGGNVAVQADGKTVICGVGGTYGLYRMGADGSIDPAISRSYSSVNVRPTLDRKGRIVVTGTKVEGGVNVPILERLFNDAGISSLSINGSGLVEWERSGGLPEVHQVTFEIRPPGGEWTSPAAAQRIHGKWVCPTLLPAGGVVRARAKSVQSKNVSLIEELLSFGPVSPDIAATTKTGVPVESGSVVNIPSVFPGFTRDARLKIENRGNGVLRGIIPILSGPNASDFSVVMLPAENLAPGDSTWVHVRFNGASAGTRSAVLNITSDDGDTPVYVIGLNGVAGNDLSPVFLSADEVAHSEPSAFDGSDLTFGTLTLGFAPDPGTVLTVVQSNGEIIAPFSDLQEGETVSAVFNGQTFTFLVGYRGGTSGNNIILTLVGDGTFLSAYESPWIGSSPWVARCRDGGMFVASYSYIGTTMGNRLVRLKRDGDLDPLFNAPELSYIGPVIVQPDEKILIADIRLNRDGSIDSSFQPDEKMIGHLALQPDGKVIVEMQTGGFGSNMVVRRLLPDGSLDAGFSSALPPAQGFNGVEVLPNGNLLVSSSYLPLTQLTSGGVPIPSFQTTLHAMTTVAQRDGKILVVAPNTSSAENPTNLKRVNADGSLDTTFTPVTNGLVLAACIQTDGKILIGGTFTQVNGHARFRTARLLTDGTLDPTFRCDVNGAVDSILPDEGNSIIITGSQTSFSGVAGKYVGRVRAAPSVSLLEFSDGQKLAWHRSGNSPELRRVRLESFEQGGTGWISRGEAVRTPDGWEMVSVAFPVNATFRMVGELSSGYPANGEIEISTTRGDLIPDIRVKRDGIEIPHLSGGLDFGEVVTGLERRIAIALENSGAGRLDDVSIWISGANSSDYSVEIGAGGQLDPMAADGVVVRISPTATGSREAVLNISSSDPDTPVFSISLLATGKTDLSPMFGTSSDIPFSYNSFDTSGRTFGALQIGFEPEPGTVLTVIENQGTASISGEFSDLVHGGVVSASHGGRTFEFLASYEGGDGNDLILRLVGPGVADLDFPAVADGTVWSVATQEDGRILIGGDFLNISGIPRTRIARLHPDGTLDRSFNASVDNRIESFAVQKDGKIIIGGVFSEVSGVTRRGIARLHPNGSLDMEFNPDAPPWVYRILLLKSGKILIGGGIDSVGGTPVKSLARLNPDGTLDDTFKCDVTGSSGPGYVYAMAEEPGGSLWIGGSFTRAGGALRSGLAKINANGSFDPSFNLAANPVSAITLQPDGKVIVGGSFLGIGTGSNIPSRRRIARFNANGTLDTFDPSADGPVTSLSVQADGRIIMSGNFTTVAGRKRNRVARVFANGTLDTSFTDPGANSMVYTALPTDRGEVMISGSFSRVCDVRVIGFAKLRNDQGTESLEIVDADSVRWLRDGALPEISSVAFETSSDSGKTWAFLGDGVRTSGGWTLDGITLPVDGYLRGIGHSIVSNRAFGRAKQTLLFGRSPTPIEAWRQNHFNSPLNAGRSGDLEDTDGDGLKNLLEYGLGFDPTEPSSQGGPQWTVSPEGHEIKFIKPPGVSGIIYGAEWSETMEEGEWYPAENLSIGDAIHCRVPHRPGNSLFYRFKVANP